MARYRKYARHADLGRGARVRCVHDAVGRDAALDERKRRADIFGAHHPAPHGVPSAETFERGAAVATGGDGGGISHGERPGGQHAG